MAVKYPQIFECSVETATAKLHNLELPRFVCGHLISFTPEEVRRISVRCPQVFSLSMLTTGMKICVAVGLSDGDKEEMIQRCAEWTKSHRTLLARARAMHDRGISFRHSPIPFLSKSRFEARTGIRLSC
jgi:hypothetical protein